MEGGHEVDPDWDLFPGCGSGIASRSQIYLCRDVQVRYGPVSLIESKLWTYIYGGTFLFVVN